MEVPRSAHYIEVWHSFGRPAMTEALDDAASPAARLSTRC